MKSGTLALLSGALFKSRSKPTMHLKTASPPTGTPPNLYTLAIASLPYTNSLATTHFGHGIFPLFLLTFQVACHLLSCLVKLAQLF